MVSIKTETKISFMILKKRMREMKGQAAERQILKLCCMNGNLSRRKVILPHKEVKTAGQQYKCKTFSFIKCPRPKHITIFSRFWVAFPF